MYPNHGDLMFNKPSLTLEDDSRMQSPAPFEGFQVQSAWLL